jgi:hypothetical protein
MPLDLQELSPKPNFEAMDAPKRIPKLAVRCKSGGSPDVVPVVPITITPPADSVNESSSSLRSSDEKTITPPTPTTPNAVATPWEDKERKLEVRSAASVSDSTSEKTTDRASSESTRQPFRHEVYLPFCYDKKANPLLARLIP